MIAETKPDVVLLDVHLPDGGGVAVLEALQAADDPPKVLALSVSDAAEDVVPVIRAGALGYVTKTIDTERAARRARDRRRRRRVLQPAARWRSCSRPSRPRRRRSPSWRR